MFLCERAECTHALLRIVNVSGYRTSHGVAHLQVAYACGPALIRATLINENFEKSCFVCRKNMHATKDSAAVIDSLPFRVFMNCSR